MFASLHLWADNLDTPDTQPQPDHADWWHLSVHTTDSHGRVTVTGSKEALRAYVAALAEQVEAIPESARVAA